MFLDSKAFWDRWPIIMSQTWPDDSLQPSRLASQTKPKHIDQWQFAGYIANLKATQRCANLISRLVKVCLWQKTILFIIIQWVNLFWYMLLFDLEVIKAYHCAFMLVFYEVSFRYLKYPSDSGKTHQNLNFML